MTSVSQSNFSSILPELTQLLGACDFVSVDLEYSSIQAHRGVAYRLFDTIQQRYQNVRETVRQCMPFQVGLTLFKHDDTVSPTRDNIRPSNVFTVHAYNFIIMSPQLQHLDKPFLCSPSALGFLKEHGMDFDEIIRSGIPFLNSEDVAKVQNLLQTDKPLMWNMQNKKAFELQCQKVQDWSSRVTRDDAPIILSPILECGYAYPNLHDLRRAFPELLIELKSSDGVVKIIVSKGDMVKKSVIDLREYRMDATSDAAKFVQELSGMTRVFNLIFKAKKPLVVHNGFLDLLTIYEKFFQPLPPDVNTFVENLHQLCPDVYDTKNVFYRLRPYLRGVSDMPDLESLFGCLQRKVNEGFIMGLQVKRCFDENVGQAHEAAYDAYMTGCVLLYLAHLIYIRHSVLSALPNEDESLLATNVTIASSEQQQLIAKLVANRRPSFKAYQHYLDPYKNCVNLIRSRNSCVFLDGRPDICDSNSSRPPLLVVTARSKLAIMKGLESESTETSKNEQNNEDNVVWDLKSLTKFLSEHGMADARLMSNASSGEVTRFLVAMASWSGARSAVRALRDEKSDCLAVREFDPWCDDMSRGRAFATLCSAVLCTGAGAAFLYAAYCKH